MSDNVRSSCQLILPLADGRDTVRLPSRTGQLILPREKRLRVWLTAVKQTMLNETLHQTDIHVCMALESLTMMLLFLGLNLMKLNIKTCLIKIFARQLRC